MFRVFVKDPSPKPASAKQKPIKQYGRKRSFLHLHNKTDIFNTLDDDEAMDLDEYVPIPEEPVPEPGFTQVANTKAKRRDSKATKHVSKFRIRAQSLQEKSKAKTAKEREDLPAKRRAEDEAIAENDRAENVFEQERARLYLELEELKITGWVEQDRTTQIPRFARGSVREGRDERQQAKRCKKEVQDIEKAICQLTWDREQVWFDFYKSIEGLSLAEKEEMRAIRETKWKKEDQRAMRAIRGEKENSPDFKVGIGKTPTDYTALFGRRKGEDCMYCDKDGCRGC